MKVLLGAPGRAGIVCTILSQPDTGRRLLWCARCGPATPSSVDVELDGREAVLVVVVAEAQQSLVSDGSVQSLPASHLYSALRLSGIVFWWRGRW